MARMSIDDMISRDTRIDRLARLCGWSRRETRACLEDVWTLCYDRAVPYLPVEDIEDTAARDAVAPPKHAGGFVAALIESGLGRYAIAKDRTWDVPVKAGTAPRTIAWPDQRWRGKVYLAGSPERIYYLVTQREDGSRGGRKSAENRRNQVNPPSTHPSTPTQEGGSSGGTQSANPIVPDPVSVPAAVSAPSAPCGSDPAIESARKRGAFALACWDELRARRTALVSEMNLAGVLPLEIITPGTQPLGFRELRARLSDEGENAPTVWMHVLEVLTVEARKSRSVEWLSGKAFSERAWRHNKEQVPTWRSKSADTSRFDEPPIHPLAKGLS